MFGQTITEIERRLKDIQSKNTLEYQKEGSTGLFSLESNGNSNVLIIIILAQRSFLELPYYSKRGDNSIKIIYPSHHPPTKLEIC